MKMLGHTLTNWMKRIGSISFWRLFKPKYEVNLDLVWDLPAGTARYQSNSRLCAIGKIIAGIGNTSDLREDKSLPYVIGYENLRKDLYPVLRELKKLDSFNPAWLKNDCSITSPSGEDFFDPQFGPCKIFEPSKEKHQEAIMMLLIEGLKKGLFTLKKGKVVEKLVEEKKIEAVCS